jgi:hypothetical protein
MVKLSHWSLEAVLSTQPDLESLQLPGRQMQGAPELQFTSVPP